MGPVIWTAVPCPSSASSDLVHDLPLFFLPLPLADSALVGCASILLILEATPSGI